MTTAICPTCGAKCNTTKKPQYKNSEYVDYFALPQPDLTRLRELYEKYSKHYPATSRFEELTEIWLTIKELLEENKL